MGAENLDPGCLNCVASALLTEPSFQDRFTFWGVDLAWNLTPKNFRQWNSKWLSSGSPSWWVGREALTYLLVEWKRDQCPTHNQFLPKRFHTGLPNFTPDAFSVGDRLAISKLDFHHLSAAYSMFHLGMGRYLRLLLCSQPAIVASNKMDTGESCLPVPSCIVGAWQCSSLTLL